MPKVETKLYRKPEEAKKAIHDLEAKGFKPEEIGVVTSEKRKKELAASLKPAADKGQVLAMGAATHISKAGGDLGKALAELWGVPEETVSGGYNRVNITRQEFIQDYLGIVLPAYAK